MAERRAHEPKLAALEAYRGQRLGAAARVRVERHLASCALCQEAFVGMQRYQLLIETAYETEPPAIDWARMELPLQREAARRLRQRKFWRAGALSVVAAAGIALFLAHEIARSPATQVSVRPKISAPSAPSAARVHVQITAIVGTVEGVNASGKRVPLDLGSSPDEGWTLETGPRSELHFALERTAALLVPPGSSLTLRSLREGELVLDLARGQVISHVRKLSASEGYEIVAARRRIAVRGTRFSVERLEPGLAVQVDEGAVAVLDENGKLLAELRAPQRWTERADPLARGPKPVAQRLRQPREPAADSSGWPVLEVPSWPHVISWGIDGAELGAGAGLRMRVPAGDLEILAELDDGRRMAAHFRVDPLGARFDPRELRWLGSSSTLDTRVVPTLDPQKASNVIHSSEAALQRCYERALRDQTSGLPGALRVRLRLELDGLGRVRHVELLAQDKDSLPKLLDSCVRQVAQGWRFAAPGGGGITFEAPISFRPMP